MHYVDSVHLLSQKSNTCVGERKELERLSLIIIIFVILNKFVFILMYFLIDMVELFIVQQQLRALTSLMSNRMTLYKVYSFCLCRTDERTNMNH